MIIESKKDFSDIFVKAWDAILVDVTGEGLLKSEIRPASQTERDICVEMGMTGDIKARILLGMDKTTGRTLATLMLGGMEMDNMDEIIPSAIGELCNMVMGTACSDLSRFNASVDITPPVLCHIQEDYSLQAAQPDSAYRIDLIITKNSQIDFNVSICA